MTNNTSTGVTAKRTARILAWLGLVLCLIASAAVVRLTRSADVGSGFYYVMGLPVTIAIVAVSASRGGSIGPMWAAIGAIVGVVIVGALSIGAFFAPAALALLAAGIAHVVAVKPRWRTLAVPLWVLLGLLGVPVIFFVSAVVQRMAGAAVVFPGETREFDAPGSIRFLAGFEVVGSWLFVSALAALVAGYLAGILWKSRAAHRRFAAAGGTALVIAIVLIEYLAISRAIAAARRGHASGCEGTGSKTTCWSQ